MKTYALLYDPPFKSTVLNGYFASSEPKDFGLSERALVSLLSLLLSNPHMKIILHDSNMETSCSFNKETLLSKDYPEGFVPKIVEMDNFFGIPARMYLTPPNSKDGLTHFLNREEDGMFLRGVLYNHEDDVSWLPANKFGLLFQKNGPPTKKQIINALSEPTLENPTIDSLLDYGRRAERALTKLRNATRRLNSFNLGRKADPISTKNAEKYTKQYSGYVLEQDRFVYPKRSVAEGRVLWWANIPIGIPRRF